jgi:hypothetical protein
MKAIRQHQYVTSICGEMKNIIVKVVMKEKSGKF